jgi:hypothetical protein
MRQFVGLCIIAVLCAVGVLAAHSSPVTAAGQLITSEQTNAVYLRASDGKRYVFPNKKTYDTWYEDFSKVSTVSPEQLASYPIGGNVPYRPGTKLVKIQSDPKVYAVEPGGVLRWVQTESIARNLYGQDWAERIDDIPAGFFNTYTIGDPVVSGVYPEGALVRDNGAYFVIWNGQKRPIDESVLEENRYRASFAIQADVSDLTEGDTIRGQEDALSDPAQLGLGARLGESVAIEALSGTGNILREQSCAPMAAFALSFADRTTIRELRFEIRATQDTDSDFDEGGLVRGDGDRNIEANLKNLRLSTADGEGLFASQSLSTLEDDDGRQVIVFEGGRTFSAGRHTLHLNVEVPEETPINQGYSAELLPSRSVFEVNGETVDDLSSDPVRAGTARVKSPDLGVTRAGGYESKMVINGATTSHELTGLRFDNARCDSVTVRDLTLTGYIDENEGEADFQPGADSDTGGQSLFVSDVIEAVEIFDLEAEDNPTIARQEIIQSNGNVAFDGIDLTVPETGERRIGVKVFFDESAPFGEGADRIAFDIKEEDDIDVYSESLAQEVDIQETEPLGGVSPGVFVTISDHGTLTIEGSDQAGGRLLMGNDQRSMYRLEFQASEEEDFRVDQLSFRILDPEALRSIRKAEVRYRDKDGETRRVQTGFQGSLLTFSDLNIHVPKEDPDTNEDELTRAWLDVDIYSSAEGAVSGDEVGFTFESGSFVAEGAVSGERFTDEDFGEAIANNAQEGDDFSVVRAGEPEIELAEEQPRTSSRRSNAEVMHLTTRSNGDGVTYIEQMTFKVETSDTGYRFGDENDDNDLLEYWADVNGDAADDDDIVTLRDDDGDVLGEGSSGEIEFSIYDVSERRIDNTPQGLTTGNNDYGLIVYKFRQPVPVYTADHELELSLDLRGIARDNQNIRVHLLGGNDFIWGDGTRDGEGIAGSGIDDLPIAGQRYNFN